MSGTFSDGLRIDYNDLGQGEPALLMTPGWCASRAMFDQLAPRSSKYRRTLALDWRGHGRSESSRDDFGESSLVEDALAVIEASGVQQVIPVATAHSGWVAIELRRRLAECIPKLVLIDWLVLTLPHPWGAINLAPTDGTSPAVSVSQC